MVHFHSDIDNNRTNDRFYISLPRMLWNRMVPGLAERWALGQLLTPQSARASRMPKVPGLLMFHRRIAAGTHELAAWEWGHGPAVLLLHDWNGQASDLEGFVKPLVDAGYRVLAVDLPAHGRSSGAQAGIGDWRRAVLTLGRHAGTVEAVIGVGLGATAAALAVQEGLNARRLALLAPPQSVTVQLREHLRGLRLSAAQVTAVLEELERGQRVRLASLDLRRIVHGLAVPALILEDAAPGEAPIGDTVRFLRQLRLPPEAAVPHVEYRAAV